MPLQKHSTPSPGKELSSSQRHSRQSSTQKIQQRQRPALWGNELEGAKWHFLPQRSSALSLARNRQHRGATLLMMLLCTFLPTALAQPWGATGLYRDRALFMLLSISHQESANSKNTVLCNLFASLVLLRRASVSLTVFLSLLYKATV